MKYSAWFIIVSIGLIVGASPVSGQLNLLQQAAPETATAQDDAQECLGKPTTAAPRGSHWFYRTERPSGRRCWFLGPDTMKVQRTETVEPKAPRAATPSVQPQRIEPEPAAAPAPPANAPGNFPIAWPTVAPATSAPSRATTMAADDSPKIQARAAAPRNAPPTTVGNRSTAQHSSEPMPNLGPILLVFTVAVTLVAIMLRAILKLWLAWRAWRKRRRTVRQTAARRRASAQYAADETGMAAYDTGTRRPHQTAERWDQATRRHAVDLDALYGELQGEIRDDTRHIARRFASGYAQDPAQNRASRRRAVA